MNPITGIVCCARTATGHAAAVLAIMVMKSRRRIVASQSEKPSIGGCVVHHSKIGRATSATGQKRTWRDQIAMSALPPIADIPRRNLNVRFGPATDIYPLPPGSAAGVV